jgi:salicylate hydroxylase
MNRVVIVGAGIGGIAAALALRRQGIDHVVLEQAARLTEVGAGIQLSPNGMRILGWLGAAPALERVAVEPGSHVFREWKTGETLLELPLGPAAREAFRAPYLHAHRADLLAAMLEQLGDRDLLLGRRVAAVRQDEGGVEAELEDGSIERGSVLIGADGVHSVVRDAVLAGVTGGDRVEGRDNAPTAARGSDPAARTEAGRATTPIASGYSAWRGLVPGDRARALGIEQRSYIWLGPGRSVVLYYVSAGRLLNWVGIGPSTEAQRESWSATGSLDALLADHDGWHPQIRDLLAATDTPFVTRLHDREPLPTWVNGRIAILGDAAHAMLPYHAQGAVQSLEDAWVLARTLALALSAMPAHATATVERDAIERALSRYQALRRDRATQVQAYSRSAQDWYHVSDPAELARRDARFRATARRGAAGWSPQQEWLYAYDAERAALGTDDEWRAMKWSG